MGLGKIQGGSEIKTSYVEIMLVKYLINCKLLCECEKFNYILSGVLLSSSFFLFFFTGITEQSVFHRTFCVIVS